MSDCYPNKQLAERFARGHTDGRANRMAISHVEDDGTGTTWTLLWGYGHALYAARRAYDPEQRDDAQIFVYDGWYGRSTTTSKHLNNVKSKVKSEFGEPRDDGEEFRALVDGTGRVTVVNAPPSGRCYVLVEKARPGMSYAKLDAADRPELATLHGKHLESPSGYGG